MHTRGAVAFTGSSPLSLTGRRLAAPIKERPMVLIRKIVCTSLIAACTLVTAGCVVKKEKVVERDTPQVERHETVIRE
jgi:hypothetical protein